VCGNPDRLGRNHLLIPFKARHGAWKKFKLAKKRP